jgi:hypothetical protein
METTSTRVSKKMQGNQANEMAAVNANKKNFLI